jgi:hypothetical protein
VPSSGFDDTLAAVKPTNRLEALEGQRPQDQPSCCGKNEFRATGDWHGIGSSMGMRPLDTGLQLKT